MPSSMDSRFGIAEHLAEQFSSNCSSICAQPVSDPTLKAGCDSGSQSYCATGSSNIATSDCVTYLDRVIQTRAVATQKVTTPYANSVSIPTTSKQTITDYYNALGSAANSYVTANIANLSSASVASIVNIMKAEASETTMLNQISDNIISTCLSSTDANCGNVDWVQSRVSDTITAKASTLTTADLPTILAYIKTNKAHFQKYSNLYGPIYKLIINTLTLSLFNDNTLVAIRQQSPDVRTAMDLMYINTVAGTTLTSIPVDSTGKYAVDISNFVKLYDATMRAIYTTFLAASTTDNLVVLIQSADAKNTARIANPFTDALCLAMKAAGLTLPLEQTLITFATQTGITKENAFIPFYYGTVATSSVTDQVCVDYVNNQMKLNNVNLLNPTTLNTYDAAIINKVMKSGTYATILQTFTALQAPMKLLMADTVAADGTITASALCQSSPDQCKEVCSKLPNMCIQDQAQRCQLPNYRYSDTFKSRESFGGDEDSNMYCWLLLLIFCIFIGGGVWLKWIQRKQHQQFKVHNLEEESFI